MRLLGFRVTAVLVGLTVILPAGGLAVLRGFDGLYGQDAFAYFDYATGPLRRALLALEPPPPFFWPPGYPLLVALASLATGPGPLAGQLVSLVMGGLAAVATALLARELWPEAPGTALVAGLLVGVSGQLWQSSTVVMSDASGLALATLGVWSSVRYSRGGGLGWLLLATLALSWAILTRWIYALVALASLIFVLTALQRAPRRRVVALHGAAAGLLGLVILASVLGPSTANALASSPGAAPFIGTLETYGAETWNPINALRSEFVTSGHGTVRYSVPNGIYYAGAALHPFMLTPLLGAFALPGLVVLVRRRAWAPLALLGVWAGGMLVFHAGSTWQNLRYVLAYLPPVAILAAVGAAYLVRLPGWPGWAARLGLVVGLVWAVAGGVLLTQRFIDRKQADLALVEWVGAEAGPQARLLTFGPTLLFRHYGQLETLELFELRPTDLPAVLGSGRPTYLVLDVANVEDQWRGWAPAEDYAWLRDHVQLEPIGGREGFTLFRIRGP